MQTIYIDVLLSINLVINYLLLSAVGFYTHTKIKVGRLCLGAATGAVCSLTILLPALPFLLDAVVKLAIGAITVISAYGRKPLAVFIRLYAVFLTATFFFCGIIIALWYIFTPKNLIIKNSVIYLNISPISLIFYSIICYLLFKAIHTLAGRHDTKDTVCILTVKHGCNAVRVKALIDTGSSLREPFSQDPVIVMPRTTAKCITPKEIEEYERVTTLKYRQSINNIRFVPFTAVGGSGILPCFRAEEVFINDRVCDKSVYIALCSDEYIQGDCQAIVPYDIF